MFTMSRIQKSVLRVADRVGVLQPLRRTKYRVRDRLLASGLISWTPLVPEEAFYACVHGVIGRLKSEIGDVAFGDYLEFGVSRGTSVALVFKALQEHRMKDVRLIGFDSFKGLPEQADEEGWRAGEYRSTEKVTRQYLASRDVDMGRVVLVNGWFSDTLNDETRKRYSIGQARLIMIDCDIYSSSKEALEFCLPHIADTAAIIFDDWGWTERKGQAGQKEAFAELLESHPMFNTESLPSYLPEARVFLVTRRRPN
jgi:O-methyltransferase